MTAEILAALTERMRCAYRALVKTTNPTTPECLRRDALDAATVWLGQCQAILKAEIASLNNADLPLFLVTPKPNTDSPHYNQQSREPDDSCAPEL